MMIKHLSHLIMALLLVESAQAITIKNLAEVQKALNVKAWQSKPQKKRIKVAVLDKGFYGYEKEIGKALPKDTQYFAGPVEAPKESKVEHGLVMAQLVTSIMKTPELYLYNVYGYSNLKAAVEDLVAKDIQLVLYSEVWEFGGNRDGKGFINALVDKAVANGITWINAAGNFGLTSYMAKIETDDEDWVKLPDQNQGLKIQCNKKDDEKCQLRAVLSWNDFKDDPELGSDKDLDLALTDDLLNVLESSSLKQTSDKEEKKPGYSSYPRETIIKEIGKGTYFLRVKNRSKNFETDDELMITVDGDGLSMPSHSRGQSVLNPADNSGVITVGALDSDRSSYNEKLKKPDLLAMSSIKTSEGEFRGSSNSAAIVAGAIGLVKSRAPQKDFEAIIEESSLPGWAEYQRGLPLNWLGFFSPRGQCFVAETIKNELPQQITDVINVGGVFVQTTAGSRLMTPFDPVLLDGDLQRVQPNDFILTTPEGYKLAERYSPYIPNGWVEVFQTPQGMSLCDRPMQPLGKIFRLKNPTN